MTELACCPDLIRWPYCALATLQFDYALPHLMKAILFTRESPDPARERAEVAYQPLPTANHGAVPAGVALDDAPFIVRIVSWGVGLIGASVLVGWAFDIESLKMVFHGLVSMKVNTAIGFVLVGVSLGLLTARNAAAWKSRVAQTCAAALIVVGAVTLIEHGLAWDLGIDERFVEDRTPLEPYPGRPSPATSRNFFLLGCAFLLLRTERPRIRRLMEAAMIYVFLISLLALVGYLLKVTSLLGLYPFWSMALHTSIAFLLSAIGVFYSRPDFGLMVALRSAGPGGTVARTMLPAVFVLTTAMGWLRLKGQYLGLYGLEFGVALYCVAMVTVFSVLVWWISRSLDRADDQRKQAEENLQRNQAELAHVQRNNTMSEMAAGISHELNQPLSSILNFASGTARRLKSGGATTSEIIEAVETIADESTRASEIIRTLNRYVQKCSPQRVPVDINAVVQGAARIVSGEARQRGVGFTVRCEPGLPEIFADRVQLKQVIVNLLSNALDALDATPSTRTILLQAQRTTSGIEVAVVDNGCGLPPNMEAKIFDAFFTTKPQGLGMGLSISRSILAAHEGRLWAERNGGRGTTFRMALPLAPAGVP